MSTRAPRPHQPSTRNRETSSSCSSSSSLLKFLPSNLPPPRLPLCAVLPPPPQHAGNSSDGCRTPPSGLSLCVRCPAAPKDVPPSSRREPKESEAWFLARKASTHFRLQIAKRLPAELRFDWAEPIPSLCMPGASERADHQCGISDCKKACGEKNPALLKGLRRVALSQRTGRVREDSGTRVTSAAAGTCRTRRAWAALA